MSTLLVILIVIVAAVALLLLFRLARSRRVSGLREAAGEYRQEAELRGARARQKELEAERERAAAEEAGARAAQLDPDT